MENLHDPAFFEFMRTCRDPYRRLADCIHAVVGVQASAVDIGCGIGLQTRRLLEHGWLIRGLDDAPAAVEMCEPGVSVARFDLTVPATAERRVDTVICTETAEHVPAEHADQVVANVAGLATKFIVWSAAAPGQDWSGHVNLQPPAYWLERFALLGWVPAQAKTNRLRDLMLTTNAQHVLGRQNFFVLVPKPTLHMTIVSTVLNKERWVKRCIESVHQQTFREWTHVVIDAKSDDQTWMRAKMADQDTRTRLAQNPVRQAALENAVETWNDLPDDEIVVWLDGDDWLAHSRALEVVAEAYTDPDVWLTYGQFMMPDGTIGFASRYPAGGNVRQIDWRATHLKTFRAGLVKKIKPIDLLKPDGTWCDLAIDHAVMYPLLEMAGEHYACIDKIVCIYNFEASWWANQDTAARAVERAEDDRFRAMLPYERLPTRPW